MKKLGIVLLLSLFAREGFAQQVAITFDDAPFGYSAGMSDVERVAGFERLLQVLDSFQVKATILITSGNMTEENQEILDLAKAAGHQLGNHTHRHLNLNEVSAAQYMADIDSCSALAGKWINSNYFRYSYLRRGNTREKRDSVYNHLKIRNLKMAPVTIDNNEWVYNRDYSIAKRGDDKEKMAAQAEEYLAHMSEVSNTYRQKAIELTGRDIPHILLLHVNPINCAMLHQLLTQYVSEGWQFITLDEAMKDPFYELKDDYGGPHGFSQIDRVMLRSKK